MSCFYERIICILLLKLLIYPALAQNSMPGYYTIKSFTTKDYRFHPKNFYISQDGRGLIYVGNAYGVMEFDGTSWRNIALINGESAMCIVSASDGKKYVGSNREAGYLYIDSLGKTKYQSLGNKMPKDKSIIGNITEIFEVDKELIFWSGSKALVYKNGIFNWLQQKDGIREFSYAKKVGNKMYFHQKEFGLMEYKNGCFSPMPYNDLFRGIDIVDLVAYNDNQFFVVSNEDLYLFDGTSLKRLPNSNKILNQHRLSNAVRLANGNLLIATHDAGAFIFDSNGTLQKQLDSENGLQSNNINYAFYDNHGGLWLALDNGLAYVEINTAFSFLERSSGLSGMGVTAALFEGRLYLGTSQGLYYSQWNESKQEEIFKAVKGISGQVWSLSVVDGMLICNHVSRLYTIKEDYAIPIYTEFEDEGNWKILILKKHPGYALVGTYSGLQLYKIQSGSIRFIRKLKGFDEACRTFEEDIDGTIWVSHGNRGLFRISIDQSLQSVMSQNYSLKNGFKPDFFNHLNFIDNQLIFLSDDGPYTYTAKLDKLILNPRVQKIFGLGYLNKFYQLENKNLLLFKSGDIIFFRKNENVYEGEYFLLKKLYRTAVGSYEFAMQLNDKFIIIGTEQGFTLFNTQFEVANNNPPYQVMLRSIIAPFHNDSLLFSGNFKNDKEIVELPYSLNSIRLFYSCNFYESLDKMNYQYAWSRKGKKLNWSGWDNRTNIDLTGIHEGEYELHIRGRNVYGSLSEEAIYSFRILPPWYRSAWAYCVYSLIVCMLAYFAFLIVRRRFKKQRFELEQKYLIEMLQKDKELMEVQRNALEEKLFIQNNELASMAAILNQRSELLTQLNHKIRSFESEYPQFDRKLLKEFMQSIDLHLNVEHPWKNFQNQFDDMHQNFLKRFKEKHPKLDETWLLLCAYIRMNKSYKEISNQLNISVAAVDKRIYRLKEKLELDIDGKIREYIQNF